MVCYIGRPVVPFASEASEAFAVAFASEAVSGAFAVAFASVASVASAASVELADSKEGACIHQIEEEVQVVLCFEESFPEEVS